MQCKKNATFKLIGTINDCVKRYCLLIEIEINVGNFLL